MDYAQYKMLGAVDSPLEFVNLGIALSTNIGAICLFLLCFYWWWKLRDSMETDMGSWFLGTAVLAMALFFWSLKGIRLVMDPNKGLPRDTLFERTGFMFAVWIKLWVATRAKPLPNWKMRNIGKEKF